MKYVALLRGINVGGKNILKMADLKVALEKADFKEIQTYINSGNIIFTSDSTSTSDLAGQIEQVINDSFSMSVPTLVVSQIQLQKLVDEVPDKWGTEPDWKYNILFLLEPYDMAEITNNIGELKPDIETLVPGNGFLYQSMSIKLFGRTTTGKLAANAIYKRMTIRNWNTTQKLLLLMKDV